MWEMGPNAAAANCGNDFDALVRAKQEIRNRRVVDIGHNNLERVQWPPSSSSTTACQELVSNMALQQDPAQDDYVFLHRKGAAPTIEGLSQSSFTSFPRFTSFEACGAILYRISAYYLYKFCRVIKLVN